MILTANLVNYRFEELLLFQCDFNTTAKCCVMVSMLTLNVVDPWVPLRSKNKDWSRQNQKNVSEWNDISTHRLLFQWTSTKNPISVFVFSFFVSKCVSCCLCINNVHITCYSLCFLLFIV